MSCRKLVRNASHALARSHGMLHVATPPNPPCHGAIMRVRGLTFTRALHGAIRRAWRHSAVALTDSSSTVSCGDSRPPS